MPTGFDSRHTLQKKSKKGFKGHPTATVAYYGPDNKRASKVAVGIVNEKNEMVAMEKWFSESNDVRFDKSINQKILDFITKQNAKSVALMDRIIGCPHEEGIDYPEGQTCQQCPFWANRDRFTEEVIH
jgi:hypothetical protein